MWYTATGYSSRNGLATLTIYYRPDPNDSTLDQTDYSGTSTGGSGCVVRRVFVAIRDAMRQLKETGLLDVPITGHLFRELIETLGVPEMEALSKKYSS